MRLRCAPNFEAHGFIKGSGLTLQAEQMLAAAVRRAFAVQGYRADSNRPRPSPAPMLAPFLCPRQGAADARRFQFPDTAEGGLLAWSRSKRVSAMTPKVTKQKTRRPGVLAGRGCCF